MNDSDFTRLEALYDAGEIRVDDAWGYFLIERKEAARWRDLAEEREKRIGVLLAAASEQENVRRMWKSRYRAARTLIDAAFYQLMADQGAEGHAAKATAKILQVLERNDALEKDAWSKAAGLAREFVKACETPDEEYTFAGRVLAPMNADSTGLVGEFVRRWHARFKSAVE